LQWTFPTTASHSSLKTYRQLFIINQTIVSIKKLISYENALIQIDYVRIYWVDLVNVRRCRIVPIQYFKQLLVSNRPGVNVAKVCLGLIYLNSSPGFPTIGEYLYALDMSTLRPLSFADGHLCVLGWLEEKTPYQTTDGLTSVQVDLCPRTLLKRIIQ